MRMRVLIGVLCFTTNQEIQDGGQSESRILSNAMSAGLREVYIYLELVKYCRNYKIKGKFVFAFHVTDNSAQITIILGPKEAPQNATAMRATFDELLLSFFGKRPYNR